MDRAGATRIAPREVLTDGLVLRSPCGEDAVPLREAIEESRGHLWPWMTWAREPLEPERVVADLEADSGAFAAGREFGYVVWRRNDGLFVGRCGLTADWKVPSFELGYWVRATGQGCGYASEAVRALAAMAVDWPRRGTPHHLATRATAAVPHSPNGVASYAKHA